MTPVNSESSISLMEPSPKVMPEKVFETAKKTIGMSTGLWFYTNDIQENFAELKGKGVEIFNQKNMIGK